MPLNKSACMRLILELVQRGHTRFAHGVVSLDKAEALADKLCSRYQVLESPWDRTRRKKSGHASVHLVMAPLNAASDRLQFWILVSPGNGVVVAQERLVDVSRGEHRVPYFGADGYVQYTLCHVQRSREQGGGRRWTWSMPAERRRYLAKNLADAVSEALRDATAVPFAQAQIDAMTRMPMFHGVRMQVLEILTEAKRRAGKRSSVLAWPTALAVMTKSGQIYARPQPLSLSDVVARMRAARDSVRGAPRKA